MDLETEGVEEASEASMGLPTSPNILENSESLQALVSEVDEEESHLKLIENELEEISSDSFNIEDQFTDELSEGIETEDLAQTEPVRAKKSKLVEITDFAEPTISEAFNEEVSEDDAALLALIEEDSDNEFVSTDSSVEAFSEEVAEPNMTEEHIESIQVEESIQVTHAEDSIQMAQTQEAPIAQAELTPQSKEDTYDFKSSEAESHFEEEIDDDFDDEETLDEIPPFLPEELEGLTGTHLAQALSIYLKRIDRLDKKLKDLKKLKHVLNSHRDVLRPLRNLENLKNLEELDNLDKLSNLKKIDQLKSLENLDRLEYLKKIDELAKLDSLSNLKSLEQLSNLRALDNLDKLNLLDGLDKLDDLEKLKNLDRLSLLDSDKFMKKMEKLDKLAIINKKFSTFVMAQMIGLFLDILKFGTAIALVFFLLSSELGRRYTAESLTAIGFGSPAQTSLGLMLLQGQVEEPKFNEIIENVRNKIKTELHTALSTGNSLTLSQRAKMLEDTLMYNYQYQNINLKEEAHQMAQRQILDAKNLVLPKIQFDIAMAKNYGNKELEKQLIELKTLFANKKYIEVVNRFGNSKLKEESVKLATIVATLEMQMQDPTTLQQVITP